MQITSRNCIVDRHHFEEQAHRFVVPTGVLSVIERVALPEGANLAVLSSEDIEPFIAEVGVVLTEGALASRVISDSMGRCALYAITADVAECLRDGTKSVIEISATGFIEENGLLSSTGRNLRMTVGAINRALADERVKRYVERVRQSSPEAGGVFDLAEKEITPELTAEEIQEIKDARLDIVDLVRRTRIMLRSNGRKDASRVYPNKSSRVNSTN